LAMKTAVIGIAICALLIASAAERDAGRYSKAHFDAMYGPLRDFDEVRLVRKEVVSTGQRPDAPQEIRDMQVTVVKDMKDSNSFFAMLEFDPQVETLTHCCWGLFNVEFYREGARVGALHYAHGRYWGPLTRDSGKKITEWLTSRGIEADVLVKEEAERDAANRASLDAFLHKSRRDVPQYLKRNSANKSPEPTPTAVTPRATESRSK
jgi:hypothetical protein